MLQTLSMLRSCFQAQGQFGSNKFLQKFSTGLDSSCISKTPFNPVRKSTKHNKLYNVPLGEQQLQFFSYLYDSQHYIKTF